ncbi:hypothetical protein BH11ARM2_BH11ARM2_32090 [soil metagenome]
MNIRFATMTKQDIPVLLQLVPQVDPNPQTSELHEQLLGDLLDDGKNNESRFSCYSRVIYAKGCVVGHLSARLVSQTAAARVISSGRMSAFTDLDVLQRLTDQELSYANRRGSGSVLFLTSIFWDCKALSHRGELQVPKYAVEHLIRWFEGNYIVRVIALIRNEFRTVTAAFEASAAKGQFTIFPIENDYSAIDLQGPWQKRAIFLDWGERLLAHRSDYNSTDLMHIDKRYIGRVLHECEFNVELAWAAGLLPTWNKTEGKKKVQESFPAFGRWRTETGKALALDVDGKRCDTNRIQRLFSRKPCLLTP